MSTITVKDGTTIYYKDWGKGPVVTLSHGWPLNSDMWDGQMLFLAQHGFRVVAHDRRGHGRSSQAWSGNDMDGYADDLAALIEALDLKDITMVGHSTGGGEVARYIGRYGTKRLAKAVLIAAVPPIMLKSAANPEGLPIEVFDGLRGALAKDRSQAYKDFAPLFYGANRPGAQVSQGTLDQFWLWSMQAGLKNAYDSIKAFSETDFTEDLKKFDIPTLVMHGEDDQIVPVKDSAKKSAKLIRGPRKSTIRACRTASPPRMPTSSIATCSRSAAGETESRVKEQAELYHEESRATDLDIRPRDRDGRIGSARRYRTRRARDGRTRGGQAAQGGCPYVPRRRRHQRRTRDHRSGGHLATARRRYTQGKLPAREPGHGADRHRGRGSWHRGPRALRHALRRESKTGGSRSGSSGRTLSAARRSPVTTRASRFSARWSTVPRNCRSPSSTPSTSRGSSSVTTSSSARTASIWRTAPDTLSTRTRSFSRLAVTPGSGATPRHVATRTPATRFVSRWRPVAGSAIPSSCSFTRPG